jgi:hypothetical protein
MSKYRIVKFGDGYAVQERSWFCWDYLKNAWGVPPLYKTAEDAEKALLAYTGQRILGVVKEF